MAIDGRIGSRLSDLREKLTEADKAVAVAEDRLASARERLQKEFGCRDEAEGAKELVRLEKSAKDLAGELEKGLTQLETEVEAWNSPT